MNDAREEFLGLLGTIDDALSQAQDCINQETPEEMTVAEANEDTISKIRDAMRVVEALRPAPVPQCEAEPVRRDRQTISDAIYFAVRKPPVSTWLTENQCASIADAILATSRFDAVSREVLIHTICPHIKQWSDGEDVVDKTCKKCPATVETSHGTGVQMCRLNAEKAADAVLALPDPGTVAVASADRECRPFCSCKASQRDGQHMAWCPAVSSTDRGSGK